MRADGFRREPSPALRRALWAVVAVLVAMGLFAAIGRTIFPDDFITRADPVREWSMAAMGRDDPMALQRPAELARADGSFAAHPVLTSMHVVPGALFLLLAPLQFSSRIRSRNPGLHRWSGRILLPLLVVTLLPGMYFGIRIPYGGPGEAVAVALFGGMLLVSIVVAFVAIRRRQIARHREWMIRVFAFVLAIATQRFAFAAIDVALTPSGIPPPQQFVLSVWTAWIVTLAAAEAWIRYTRPRVRVVPVATPSLGVPAKEITDGDQYRAVGKFPAAG